LAERDLLSREHIVDAGSMTADHVVTSQTEHAVNVLGPVPSEPSWQAKERGGFATSCFSIDGEVRQATCPQGRTSRC